MPHPDDGESDPSVKERIRRLDGHGSANGKPIRLVVAALILRSAPPGAGGSTEVAGGNTEVGPTEVLVCQRRPDQPMSLKWEFPGGKIELGETAEQALTRELDEELGIAAVIGPRVAQIRHRYRNGGIIDLQFFTVRDFAGELNNRIFNAVVWTPLSTLPTFDFLAADLNLIRDLSEGKLL
jgi:8-oxo-dGTP diphosphatase